jgi:hypothetical protein
MSLIARAPFLSFQTLSPILGKTIYWLIPPGKNDTVIQLIKYKGIFLRALESLETLMKKHKSHFHT